MTAVTVSSGETPRSESFLNVGAEHKIAENAENSWNVYADLGAPLDGSSLMMGCQCVPDKPGDCDWYTDRKCKKCLENDAFSKLYGLGGGDCIYKDSAAGAGEALAGNAEAGVGKDGGAGKDEAEEGGAGGS